MAVRGNPEAVAFLRSLSQAERDRLLRCWRLLSTGLPVDNVAVFNFPIPPLVFRLHRCGGFDTLYKADATAQHAVIFAVAQAGQGRSLRP